MLKLVRMVAMSAILICLFAVVVNISSIYSQYNQINNLAKVMVSYGQKNGGFVDSVDMSGTVIDRPFQFMESVINQSGLQDNIDLTKVTFTPNIDIRVQKRDEFSILIQDPKIKVLIPFVGEREFILDDIQEFGLSHKYFK